MKLLKLIGIFIFSISAFAGKIQKIKYKDGTYSSVEWKRYNSQTWTDYDLWKDHRELKDKYPKWEVNIIERNLDEDMGRVIACVGRCILIKGGTKNKLRHRSLVKEGDDIETGKDSYLWLYLMDGSIARLSPESSISLKEININDDRFYIYIRVNKGHLSVIKRQKELLKPKKLKETDSLFLPVELYEANQENDGREFKEDELFKFLEESNTLDVHYKKLNELIISNNVEKMKSTFFFVVLPNGNIEGKDISFDAFVNLGYRSLFRIKDANFQEYQTPVDDESFANFYYRGMDNTEKTEVEKDKWYEISTMGETIEQTSIETSFLDFQTRRIPTILKVREFFFKKYSTYFHKFDIDRELLALKHSYRLWNSETEFNKRRKFIMEYVRRTETANLLRTSRFIKRMIEKGIEFEKIELDRRYYSLAHDRYFSTFRPLKREDTDRRILNSTKKRLWKIMHDIR